MAKAQFKWTGLKELRRDLSTFAKDLTDDTRAIALRFAESAAADMRGAYPRSAFARSRLRPKHLADSVAISYGKRDGLAVSAIFMKNTAWYAHFVEHGTIYMDARPVFYPILRRKQIELQDAITSGVFPKFNLRAKGA